MPLTVLPDQLANIVVAAPPPTTITIVSSASPHTQSNGHLSPLATVALTNDDAPYDSESDLSEVAIPIIDEPSPAPTPNQQAEYGAHDTEASDSSPAEVVDESDDADFDMDDSPAPAPTDSGRHERSTSSESRRPPKRKLGVEDDQHILANPELYGLRRSVRIITL